MRYRICGALAGIALLAATPSAQADTKAGVDAWAQGDYARALKVWRPLAEAGDADAQFNLGQAYKMGRGVQQDPNTALEWYRKAAAQGHSQAEDAYGLLLYQQNRRPEAMPSLLRSADRGEARAQYLVGIALFNGDLLPRDWTRAYALMTRASASGVEQASAALAQMDRYIPEHQRRDGLALAAAMEARKAREAGAAIAASSPSASQHILRPAPSTKPIRSAAVPPSQPAPPPVSAPSQAPASAPAPAAKSVPASGGWQVQLGAFGEAARAQAQWKTLTAKIPALAAAPHRLEPAGAMTRLLAGSLSNRAEADALCAKIKAAGADCIVKPR